MIVLEREVAIRLRDGIVTRANVWRPSGGQRVPAVLVRTPYSKDLDRIAPFCDPRVLVPAGFAVVAQDVRGRGGSEGTFTPFEQELEDGYDTVEAVAALSWCSGDVVMAGNSYVGATQWLAAAAAPPSLRAIVPALTTARFDEGWTFTSGVLELAFVCSWIAGGLAGDELWAGDVERAYRDRERLRAVAPWVERWLEEPSGSPYWRSLSAEAHREHMRVPALSVGGWYDRFVGGTLSAFAADRHPSSRLVVGPWAHDGWTPYLPGTPASGLLDRLLGFYRAAVAGFEPAEPRVSAYVLGTERWLEVTSWPPSGPAELALPLSGGSTFSFRPDTPPPSLGGRALRVNVAGGPGWGQVGQRRLAAHPGVLRLQTAPFAGDVLLAGPVRVRLAGTAATGDDCADWVCVLCTTDDRGRLVNLCEGIARAPAATESVAVELGDVCIELPRGARLEVLVAGGSYPRWEPLDAPRAQTVAEAELVVQRIGG
jgi:putative CocE/NonD family hydrolase